MTQLRVRARAVDMLGRQQIAGIPNAIHELFKNAHDAYAERVEVDYFRRNRVLVIRDDGYGMTRHDVENRWLTLGTESRVNANSASDDNEWRGPKKLPKRAIMGEKGIGRLAIAVIAPITLLMTRASRPDGLSNLVVALVHWGLFEQPGLDVSAIDVPVEEFPGGTLPTREDVGRMVHQVAENINALKKEIPPEAFDKLQESLERIKVIGPDLLDKTLNKDRHGNDRDDPLSLAGQGYGTHFIVLPVAPELDEDIDGGIDNDSSKLERNLLGFSNLMASAVPVIKTEFRDHLPEGVEERIGSRSFFSDEDFTNTDQYFEGNFDEYGQFVGTVSIYGKSRQFVCNWGDGKGRTARCGPFYFRYGYVQGDIKESTLSPENWTEIFSKIRRFGGLYIYRDGVRVLPYGNSDVDWLDIEKRRSLKASDWFFSYRRGFGFVAINHEANSALVEKAGREGFRENLAYRDFRAILINFFKQLAYEFFRPTSPQGSDFVESKARLQAEAALLDKQRKKADSRRKEFEAALELFNSRYNDNFFEAEAAAIESDLAQKLESLDTELDLGDFASRVRLAELDAQKKIRNLYSLLSISLPRGLSLTKNLQKSWLAFGPLSQEIKESVLDPLREKLDSLVDSITKGRIENSEKREFALQDVMREKDNAVRDLIGLRRETADAIEIMQASVQQVLRDEFSELRVNVENLVEEFAKRSAENPEQLDSLRHDFEQRILDLKANETELFESLKRQMLELAEGVKDRETLDDRFAALEARNQSLEELVEFYSEFAQLGMSVGILQHEFLSAARGIRQGMGDLKPWADRNPPLAEIYKRLRDHIEHLDGYLKVLDPLGRRMHRSIVRISGDEILRLVLNVFAKPLSESGIRVEPTFKFRDFKVEAKSSVVLGAFINIIDNAIFWLNSRSAGDKKIYLDADERGFLISNNGPGIEALYRDRIFEFGETRKVGGRGMGLAISREALKKEGFELELIQFGANENPIFRIAPTDVMEEEGSKK